MMKIGIFSSSVIGDVAVRTQADFSLVRRARKAVWPGHPAVPSIVAPDVGEHAEQNVFTFDVPCGSDFFRGRLPWTRFTRVLRGWMSTRRRSWRAGGESSRKVA